MKSEISEKELFPANPDDWSDEIAELETFFSGVELPTEPIRVNAWSTITNCTRFVASHLEVVKAKNGKRWFLSELERLQELKQILTINSN